MYISEGTNLEMWQLRNTGLRPTARPRVRRYMSGLSAVEQANSDVAELLADVPVYAEAKKKLAELDQRILVLDYNITVLKIADVPKSERASALKVLNDQRVVAVADQKKLQKVIADMQIAAAKDARDMNAEELATYRKQLSDRYVLLRKARAEAVASVEPAQLDVTLAKIDVQLDKVKTQMIAAGATSFKGLSSLEKSFWEQIKTNIRHGVEPIRNVTKRLPGAKFFSDKIAPIVAAPIVRMTGTKKQRKAAKKALKVIVIAAAVVVGAVYLGPLIMPTLQSAGSGALGLVKGGFGLVKSGVGFVGKFAGKLIPKGAGGKIQELLKKGMTKDNLKTLQNIIAGKPEDEDTVSEDESIPEDTSTSQDTSTGGYPVQYRPESQGMSTNMKIGLAAGGVGVLVLTGLFILALRK